MEIDVVRLKNSYFNRRDAFHKLLDDIPDDMWHEKMPGSAWTVSHNLWHVTLVQKVFTHTVRGIRKGRSYPLSVTAVIDLLSTLIAYRLPSKHNKQEVKENFNTSLAEYLEIIDEMNGNEWELSGKLAGKERTISEIYRGSITHIDEHMEQVYKLLPQNQ